MFRRIRALALLGILAGCGNEPAPPAPEPRHESESRAAPPVGTPAPAPARSSAVSVDAADLLRDYYRLIDERRYAVAHALREPNGADAEAFAAYFERFQSQKVTVGQASEPAEAGDWLYVEVPVQTYGSMKDGTPFGSAGTVTLRRRKSGGAWRIFTKG